MDAAEVLVTGGIGLLGRRSWTGCEPPARACGCSAGVDDRHRSGRPADGDGLDGALHGVTTVVHCDSSPSYRKVDVEGTERLLRMASRASATHVDYISIVGVYRNPFPYYRAKLDAGRAVERSPVPETILRATQFHDLILKAVGGRRPALVELALADPTGRVPDIGGPEVWTAKDLMRTYFFVEVKGGRRRVLQLPLPGGAARAFRDGVQVCPENRYGRVGWEKFLRRRIGAEGLMDQAPSASARHRGGRDEDR